MSKRLLPIARALLDEGFILTRHHRNQPRIQASEFTADANDIGNAQLTPISYNKWIRKRLLERGFQAKDTELEKLSQQLGPVALAIPACPSHTLTAWIASGIDYSFIGPLIPPIFGRITTLTLSVNEAGRAGYENTLSILLVLAPHLRALQLHMASMPFTSEFSLEAHPEAPFLDLPRLVQFRCHFGTCRWSNRLAAKVFHACKPDQLRSLWLIYLRFAWMSTLSPETVLQNWGRGLQRLGMFVGPDPAFMISKQLTGFFEQADLVEGHLKQMCPRLEYIVLNKVDVSLLADIAATFPVLRLDCQYLDSSDFQTALTALSKPKGLQLLYLSYLNNNDWDSDIYRSIVESLNEAGWEEMGYSTCGTIARYRARKVIC